MNLIEIVQAMKEGTYVEKKQEIKGFPRSFSDLEIGQKVRSCGNPATIVAFHSDSYLGAHLAVGIHFDVPYGGHNLNGEISDNRGYWVAWNELEIM